MQCTLIYQVSEAHYVTSILKLREYHITAPSHCNCMIYDNEMGKLNAIVPPQACSLLSLASLQLLTLGGCTCAKVRTKPELSLCII